MRGIMRYGSTALARRSGNTGLASIGNHRFAAMGVGAAVSAYSAYQGVSHARQGNYARANAWGVTAALTGLGVAGRARISTGFGIRTAAFGVRGMELALGAASHPKLGRMGMATPTAQKIMTMYGKTWT